MSQVKYVSVHETKPVTAGGVLTFSIPAFKTIDDIILTFTNNGAAATDAAVKAAIGNILFSINGEQVISTPISTIFDIYQFLGVETWQTKPAGVISLNLARLIFKNPSVEKLFAIGCQNVSSIQLQVACGATTTNVTNLQVSTSRRNFDSVTKSYLKIVNYPQTMTATGTSTVDTLPKDSNDSYIAVLASNGGGVISQGEAVLNGSNITQPIMLNTANYIAAARGHQPVTGYFPYDFCDGSLAGVVPMQNVTELRFKTTFSTAPTNGVYDLVAITIRNTPADLLKAALA